MSRKVIKYFFELAFIFVIPLLIICLNCNYQNTIAYDDNGNFQSTEKYFEFNPPFSYIKDNEYVNYLEFNQLLTANYNSFNYNGVSTTINNYLITLSGVCTGNTYYFILQGIQIDPSHKYLLYSTGSEILRTSATINDETNYISCPTILNNCTALSIYVNLNNGTDYTGKTIIPMLIDLTLMYGSGYEPTYNEFIENFPNQYYSYNVGTQIKIESDDIISSNYATNYTIWGRLKNSFTSGLELQDNFVLDFVITYTILWFSMFLIWHIIYLLFDKLFHLRRE